jgi:hypothetical protein
MIPSLLIITTETPSDPPAPALPKGYVCCRTDSPLTIDGRLNKPAWLAAPWTDDFVDIAGDLRPKPRFRTRAKMLWDDTYLYIGAEMEEPHVWGTLTEHDSVIFQDNDFEVFIDPDSDNHEYYEIEINALNTVWDLRLPRPYRDLGSALNEWEIPGLKTAVWIEGTLNDPRDTDRGWSVEMAFPWTVLAEFANCPAPPHDGDQWRINFSRVEWEIEIVEGAYRKIAGKPEDNWVWSPQGVVDMHRPEMWGYVQFSTAPAGSVAFRPDPTAPARDALHRVYYAQRDFQEQHGRWAATLAELGLPTEPNAAFAAPLEIRPTPDGYQASVLLHLPGGKPQRWHIRQDSRVWTE